LARKIGPKQEDATLALSDRRPQAPDDSDQRNHPRDRVVYSGRLSYGAREYPCAVLDISAGGAQVRFAEPLAVWTIVTLYIDRFGGFHARVVWQQRDKVGLQFLEDAVLITNRIIAASRD
jgi:PilZ domain